MVAYDYSCLNGSGDKTKEVADTIKADLQQIQKGLRAIIRVGLKLDSVKDSIPHGQWAAWLESEFDLSDRTARRYMQIGRKFESVSVGLFTDEVLSLLVPNDVPKKAIDKIIRDGAATDTAKAMKIVEANKPPKPKKVAVNRIAKHLSGDGPVEFASDEQTTEAKEPESKPWIPSEPSPELASHIESGASVSQSDPYEAIHAKEREVAEAFAECKSQSDDSSEFAFDQAMEIIRLLAPEYHKRAKVIIDELVSRIS